MIENNRIERLFASICSEAKSKANTDDDEAHVKRVMSYKMNRKFSSRMKETKRKKQQQNGWKNCLREMFWQPLFSRKQPVNA